MDISTLSGVSPAYLNTYTQSFPEDVIEIDAADFCRYEDRGEAAEPVIFSDYEGMDGDSVLTTESALIEYDFEVPQITEDGRQEYKKSHNKQEVTIVESGLMLSGHFFEKISK